MRLGNEWMDGDAGLLGVALPFSMKIRAPSVFSDDATAYQGQYRCREDTGTL